MSSCRLLCITVFISQISRSQSGIWHLQHVALFPTFALFVIDGRQKLHTPVRELTLKPVEAAAKETKERQQWARVNVKRVKKACRVCERSAWLIVGHAAHARCKISPQPSDKDYVRTCRLVVQHPQSRNDASARKSRATPRGLRHSRRHRGSSIRAAAY